MTEQRPLTKLLSRALVGELDYKKRILRGILIGLIPIEVMFVLIGWRIQNPLTYGMHLVILACVILAIATMYSRLSDTRIRRYYLVLVTIGLAAILVTNVQDFAEIDLLQYTPWMTVVAVLGVFLIGRIVGIIWAVVYLGLVGIPFLLSQPAVLPPEQINELRLNTLIVVVAMTILTVTFEWSAGNIQRRLIQQQREAEQANRAKSDFLANMSHELRTPMNHIIGFTELVLDNRTDELNKEKTEYLQDVLASSRHLLELINDMLDLSKIEAGKVTLEYEDIDIAELIESSVGVVAETLNTQGIALDMDLDRIPPAVPGDRRKLRQVIYNILSNAVKFTQAGGSIRIAGQITADGNHLDIGVWDSGIGIGEENLERIFMAFEQGDNTGNHAVKGTGLGLSVSRRLVELHGGSIWAESEGEGRGAVFHFTLPLVGGAET